MQKKRVFENFIRKGKRDASNRSPLNYMKKLNVILWSNLPNLILENHIHPWLSYKLFLKVISRIHFYCWSMNITAHHVTPWEDGHQLWSKWVKTVKYSIRNNVKEHFFNNYQHINKILLTFHYMGRVNFTKNYLYSKCWDIYYLNMYFYNFNFVKHIILFLFIEI